MSPTNLFTDLDLPLTPVARPEPPLWVRRVVLAAALSPTAPLLRDPVELRPGLNVIRVAARPPGDTRRIGNSVGKTLLTRLIRYSLGETHFANERETRTITRLRAGACVLAEVRVGGESWVTCRPLRDAPLAESFAVRAESWSEALVAGAPHEPFPAFLDAVTAAVVVPLPEWRIPGEGRAPRWLDVLAWLARDQECSFRHPNKWRHPDARSGTGELDADDAALLAAWVMGLLDTTEIREQRRRSEWLATRRAALAEADRLDRDLDAARPDLCRRLNVSDATLDDGLNEEAINDAVARTKAEIEAEQQEDADGGALHDAVVTAAGNVRSAETTVTLLGGMIGTTRGELAACQPHTRAEYMAQFDISADCPLKRDDCSKSPTCTNAVPDPEREARVADLKDHLARYSEELNECNARLPRLRAEAEDARRRWQEEGRVRRLRLVALGRADALADDYARYRAARVRRDEWRRRAEELQRRIDESHASRRAARGDRERRRSELSAVFDATMKALIGPDAGGGVVLDARGLQPAPDATAGVSGAGLGTLAAVLGYDLACLAAGVAGVGFHPGFVIHDSPHNADIEDVLYQRVFDRVRQLESLYGSAPVGFQYVVTTTTPPPASCDRQPFVRLTLDAREDGSTLLGVRW